VNIEAHLSPSKFEQYVSHKQQLLGARKSLQWASVPDTTFSGQLGAAYSNASHPTTMDVICIITFLALLMPLLEGVQINRAKTAFVDIRII
jgi:hypothetical protein